MATSASALEWNGSIKTRNGYDRAPESGRFSGYTGQSSNGPSTRLNILGRVALFEIRDLRRVSTDVEVDPVCRMQIPRGTAPARLPFEGRSYAFCSMECAKLFADAPSEYVGS